MTPPRLPSAKTETIEEAMRLISEEKLSCVEAAARTGLHRNTVNRHAIDRGIGNRRTTHPITTDQRDAKIAKYATENKTILPEELSEKFGVSIPIATRACKKHGIGIDFRARREMRKHGIACEEEYAATMAIDADMKAEAERNRSGLTNHRWEFAAHRNFDEVAEILKCPQHQVRAEHDRAIVKLRRALASQYRFANDTPNRSHDHLYASMD